MDDPTAEAIVNRDDPIPVLRIPAYVSQPGTPVSESERKPGKREKLKDQANKVKEKLDEYGSPNAPSIQDRLFAGIMSQIIPPEELSETEDAAAKDTQKDRRSRKYIDKPGFSIPLMSTNFRRFNSRVGIVFVFENRLLHLFTWRQPTQTLSFLAVYTLVCLDPALLPVVPLVLLLFYIMIPSFLARHPAPANDPRIEPSHYGPPIAPPSRVKPAPELSKDFFRNMRDLQNSMEDFSRLHDAANEYITPYTNFSDEGLSSLLFLFLFVVANAAFLASHLVPWRAVALMSGWITTVSGHPEAQKILFSSSNLSQVRHNAEGLGHWLHSLIDSDIILDEPPETRQVEVFELQKWHPYSDTWEAWLFSPSPFDPLSPARIAGARAKGTQFFEEVQVPSGWTWRDKKWSLDLFSREWVEQRMITGVEIETEGERWVYDIPVEDVDVSAHMAASPTKSQKKTAKSAPKSGWEEGTGLESRGEWRRRRWIRCVERKVVKASPPD